MRTKTQKGAVALAVIAVLVAVACGTQPGRAKPDLSVIWFSWPPCEALGQLTARYQDANVKVTCIPIGQWHDQIFTDFAARGGADFPILDSQWIGEAVTGGHLVELTEWMKQNIEVSDYVPAALSAYGEYPPGSGRYWGVPAMADVQILFYRKDVFQRLNLQPPKTWTELLAHARRIKQSGIVPYGFVWFWCGSAACYDQIQTAWNQIAWSFGGELWDPKTYRVEGVLNSPENLRALEFARELFKTGPETGGNWTFSEVVDAMCTGQAAMTIIWIGFGPNLTDPSKCKQAGNFAFAVPPGEKRHFLSLGGMGLHVSAYTKNRDAALAFVKWFESRETQIEWVKLGGYSARISVLNSEEFRKAAAYNAVFAEAYQKVKDFWNLPEYSSMLTIQGEQLNLAVTGQKDPKAALDLIAREQQRILDKAYPKGPPK